MDEIEDLRLKKIKTDKMRESIKLRMMISFNNNFSSDDDSQQGEISEVEISEDEAELKKEEKFVDQYERVMKGTNKNL